MCNYICFIVILFFIKLSDFIVECDNKYCKDINANSKELQLKTHLFCDYDSDVRPETKRNNKTEIVMIMMPKFIEFDDMTDTLSVHTWIHMNWSDPHLTWNPEDFDGLSDLTVPSTEIWVPDLTVQNAGDLDDDTWGIPKTNCLLNNDGGILCVPVAKYVAHCNSDYTNYPYDIQNCTIELASWAYTSDEVVIYISKIGVMLTDFTPHQDWKVIDYDAASELHDYKMNQSHSTNVYKLNFVIQRRNAATYVIYVVPAFVLMIMTLSVLWLDCQSKERMIVACMCFICHLICMQHLYVNVPYNGGVVPYILQFYEHSFLLITFALILTVLLRELQALTSAAPDWLSSSTSFVLQSKVGQLLLLSILDPKASAFLETSADDNADLMHAVKRDSTWNYVTLLIGWLAFIAVFFVYIILLTLYIPSNLIDQ